MKALLLLLLVTACGSSSGGGQIGGSCDRENPCDEGVCSVTHTGDGTGECLAGDEDIDGDGLPNSMDFCNSSEGGQYDEDRDLIGDDCDKCPIYPPPAQPDPDGDDVDSPCDPDPRTPGDVIVAFDGFRDGIPSTWAKSGTWENVGADAVATGTGSAVVTLTTVLPMTTTKMAIFTQYRIDGVEDAAQRNYVGLIARDLRPASSAVAKCGSSRSSAVGDSLSLETDAGAMSAPVIDAFNEASLYSVALRTEGLQAGCAMIADNTQVAAQAAVNGDALTETGMFVTAGTARFTYFLAVQRP